MGRQNNKGGGMMVGVRLSVHPSCRMCVCVRVDSCRRTWVRVVRAVRVVRVVRVVVHTWCAHQRSAGDLMPDASRRRRRRREATGESV